MAHVGLIVSSPRVTFRNSRFGADDWRLTFETSVPWRSRIKLADGRNLRDIPGTIGFESDAQEPYKGFAKGSLSFWEGRSEPTSYLATIRLSPDELARLMQTIQAGLPLESVNIDVEGLEHGWGEGEAKWDVVEHQAVEVQGYTLWFGQPKRDADEIVPGPTEEAVETDAKSLVAIRELHRTMRYLLFAVVVLIFAVWLHR